MEEQMKKELEKANTLILRYSRLYEILKEELDLTRTKLEIEKEKNRQHEKMRIYSRLSIIR